MARTTYVAGPGVVVYDSRSFFTRGDIKIVEEIEGFDIEVSYYGGKVDSRAKHRYGQVSFEPAGEFEASDLAVLYPYGSKKYGDDIFGSSDKTLRVFGVDGTLRTYAAAAITKMPSLRLGMNKHPFGEVQFLCLGSGDTDWSTANSLVQVQTGQSAPAELTSDALAVADLVRAYFVGNWPATGASAPWLNFTTIDGFDVDFNLNLFDKENDRYGIQNKGISGIGVTAKFKPSGMVESDILTAAKIQGGTTARGMSLAGNSLGDLKITGGTSPKLLTVTVKSAVILGYDVDYGVSVPRLGEIRMESTLATLGATVGDHFTIGIS